MYNVAINHGAEIVKKKIRLLRPGEGINTESACFEYQDVQIQSKIQSSL
jgi:hypothetical protein